MELYQGFLTGNLPLDMAITGWFTAQVLKGLIQTALHHRFDWRTFIGSGGMPSSHSAFVCALAVSLGGLYGWRSPLFALAACLAAIVMYDACNVRRAAGEQAKVLNHLLHYLDQFTPDVAEKALKELLGHTPLQVLMGALLGSGIGALAWLTR